LWLILFLVATVLPAGAQHRDRDDDDEAREEAGLQQGRREWFSALRKGDPARSAHARLKSVEEIRRRNTGRRGTASANAGANASAGANAPAIGNWLQIGPQPATFSSISQVSGRVTALAVSPGNTAVVYMGTADGGVWKTIDGGATWTPLTDSQPSLSIGDLTLDPENPNTVLAATGDPKSAAGPFLGVGLLRSTDGGATWTNIPGPFAGTLIPSIAIHPSNSAIWLVSCDNPAGRGIYRTSDGGVTWTVTLSAYTRRVLFDPQNGNVAYATTLNGQIFRSADAGVSWTAATGSGSNALPAGGGYTELGIDPTNTSTLYASIASGDGSNNLLGVFKSVDSGANWTPMASAPDYCSPQCSYNNFIRVFPGNNQLLFLGGILLYYSLDGGNTWTSVPDNVIHDDQQAMAFSSDGTTLYEGNDGGVWSNVLPGSVPGPWTNLNATLAITQFYPGLSINPTSLSFMLGGTQDNGTQLYSGSLLWNSVACGDGGRTAINPVTPTTVYVVCAGLNIAILKSTNSGAAGSLVEIDGPIPREQHAFVPAFAMDPSNPSILYFGTTRVFQSKDGGTTWNPISPSFTAGIPITSIAVAPTDSNTVYAATLTGQVEKTASALQSATWTDITSGLPGISISTVAVNPQNSQSVCVGTSAYTFGTAGHFYLSVNGGTSWTDETGDLPDLPVNDLVIDPDAQNTFYVATDAGVFRTSDGGAHWSPPGTGLPLVAVMGLHLHRPTRTLVAATFGRSVWEVSVPTAGPPAALSVSPSSGSGPSQTFVASYSAGGAPINLVYFLVNTGIITPLSCFVQYNPAANTYQLLNDAGTTLSAAVTAGSTGSASNSQCTISGAGGGSMLSGSSLTVNFPITFNSAYAGAQNVFLFAYDSSGQNSGWQQLGTWTVPGTGGTLPAGAIAACGQNGAPCVASLTPANGSGLSGTFTGIFTDPGGAGAHALGYILFLPTPNIVWYTATGSCLVEYNRISDAMRLINDAGTDWLPGTVGIPLSQGGTLTNSHCTLDVTHSSASINGDIMTVTVKVTFNPAFTGQLATFLQAFDMAGNFTSMTQFGNWMAAPAPTRPPGPYVVGVSPTSGTGSSTTLSFTAGHTSGVPALAFVTMLISSVIAGGVPCQVFYFEASNTLNLVNDGGTAMVSAGIVPGTAGTLSNSRCSINTGGATETISGDNVTVSVPMTFNTTTFGGKQNVYVNAFDNYGFLSHWVTGGSWTVQ